jgi:hypothetical protein
MILSFQYSTTSPSNREIVRRRDERLLVRHFKNSGFNSIYLHGVRTESSLTASLIE